MSEERKNSLSRREFLRAAAITAAGSLLAACAPKATEAPTKAPAEKKEEPTPTTAPPEKEAVTISYWVFWTQYGDCVPGFIDEFKEAVSPNDIDVKWGVQADEVFLTNVAAGTPPDVGTGHHYLDYMSRGQVVPIDDMIATSKLISPENFIVGNWNVCGYQGKQYGVPAIECFVRRGLNYNTRMVEEAGLDPDDPPVTWAETLEWHKKLTKFDSAGNLVQIGLDPYDAEGGQFAGNDGSCAQESWGFKWFDEETKTFNLDNEMQADIYETYGEFVRIIGPDNLSGLRQVEGQGTWGGSYNAEVQAMIIEGYWHPGETAYEKPEVSKVNRCTWVPVPESRRGAKIQFGGGHMVFFYKDATNPIEVAWPVGEFLQSKTHCDAVFNTIGWLPAFKSYIAQTDPSIYPGLEFYFKSVEETNEWSDVIHCEIFSFARQKNDELKEAVYRDEMTGKEAVAALQAACEEEWEAAGFG